MNKGEGKWRPVDPMRHHRENGWDYRGRAIYHFTMPVEARYPLFGVLEGESAEKAFVSAGRAIPEEKGEVRMAAEMPAGDVPDRKLSTNKFKVIHGIFCEIEVCSVFFFDFCSEIGYQL